MPGLEIPSFDVFLAEMGEEGVMRWAATANAAVQYLSPVPAPVTQEGVNAFITAMAAYSHQLSIEMLRDYHAWLSEQLAQRSLRLL